MATETNQLGRKDNTALWTVIALIVIAVLAYAAYATYYDGTRNDNGIATTDGTTRNIQ
jgi:uncharacterized membrane protein YebE (DUF533 family)